MEMFVPKFIAYQLYLLQLENYELGRYWWLLKSRGFFPNKRRPLRKELVWTAKARALMLMAAALHFLAVVAAGSITISLRPSADSAFSAMLVIAVVLTPLYFLLFSAALLVIRPLDAIAKDRLVSQAKAKLAGLPQVKVVGIAGSYGKTTMKEVLGKVLSTQYTVLSTPESVNTPVGIARFILNKVTPKAQVLILELGEHYRGDVKQLCEIARPDVVVVTGINEAHLERMGSLSNIVATIFEATESAKDEALVVVNGDDKNVRENFSKFIKPGQKMEKFQISNLKVQKFNIQRLAWEAEVEGLGEIEIGLLGEYALGDAAAAIIIARALGLSDADIRVGLANVKPVEHRLQPIKSSGNVLVIDDSYNGNPAGAAEAIKVLSRFEERRKIYITPGLVEAGVAAADVHKKIGEQLAAADIVILIKNSVTPWIEQGIKSATRNIKGPEVVWFETAQAAHDGLKNIIKPGDAVLFQNDWGDQYL